mmetsp:Transcript_35702/g.91139  ORF Transcript_35702/g.91139 Transcript_35702/m.91139 type:complete len:242 (+) Transcript_35702:84-809(+)
MRRSNASRQRWRPSACRPRRLRRATVSSPSAEAFAPASPAGQSGRSFIALRAPLTATASRCSHRCRPEGPLAGHHLLMVRWKRPPARCTAPLSPPRCDFNRGERDRWASPASCPASASRLPPRHWPTCRPAPPEHHGTPSMCRAWPSLRRRRIRSASSAWCWSAIPEFRDPKCAADPTRRYPARPRLHPAPCRARRPGTARRVRRPPRPHDLRLRKRGTPWRQSLRSTLPPGGPRCCSSSW